MDAMEYCAYVYDTGLVILDNLQALTPPFVSYGVVVSWRIVYTYPPIDPLTPHTTTIHPPKNNSS